jgi:hypothetical protein
VCSATTVLAGRPLGGARCVHRVGDLVELVLQEMPVQSRVIVADWWAEHRLHHLDVRSAGDGQRGGGAAARPGVVRPASPAARTAGSKLVRAKLRKCVPALGQLAA